MVRKGTRNGSRMSRSAIQNVRLVPENEGNRAEKVNRQITAYKETQGQIRVVVKANFPANLGTATVTRYSFANLRTEGDFVALSAQFRTYKVAGIRFDVYDADPLNSSYGLLIGTYHTVDPTSVPSNKSQVEDLPDSGIVPNGEGLRSWFWYPTGPLENSWYQVNDNSVDFGGLAINLPAGDGMKFDTVISYIVDFRARV